LAKTTKLEALRESERLLQAELIRLRERIAAAEKGQNKRIKDALKYIANTNKQIARVNKVNDKLQEQELERLEKFLGETFETVDEARAAFLTQTTKPTSRELLAYRQTEKKREQELASKAKTEAAKKRHEKRAASLERAITGRKLDSSKPKYTVRQLSASEHQNVIDFLTDKKTFNDAGMDYLLPSERITVSVPYQYRGTDGRLHNGHALGRRVFTDWNKFQAYLITYMKPGENGEGETYEEWLGDIEVIKFPDEYSYRVDRGKQTDVINKRRKDVQQMFSKRERERRKKAVNKARMSERAKLAKAKAKHKEQIRKLKGR
jgi:hypothetical protein